MKKTLPLLLVFSLVLMTFPTVSFAAETVEDPYEAYLRLGKPKPGVDQVVGGLQIWNDTETLFVQFETDEPFCISALHLQVANDLSDVPEMGGMILPGSAINEDYDDCLPVRGPFEFNLIENGWNAGSNLVIAAHADIGEQECHEECVTIQKEPYPPDTAVGDQGDRIYGGDVLPERSDPGSVLIWEAEPGENDNPMPDDTAFFSLGLKPDEEPEQEGGSIVVWYENPILNRDGVDLIIVEDTWVLAGEDDPDDEYMDAYWTEMAKVEASKDGENWVELGFADNQGYTTDECLQDPFWVEYTEAIWWQTVSCLDLGPLDEAHYIRVTDIFIDDDPNNEGEIDGIPIYNIDFQPTWDGFDLNVILSLQDYEECTEVCEDCYLGRAWAGNKIGSGAAWSRWVRYLVTGEGAVQDNGILTVLDIPEEIAAPAINMNDGAARQQILRGR